MLFGKVGRASPLGIVSCICFRLVRYDLMASPRSSRQSAVPMIGAKIPRTLLCEDAVVLKPTPASPSATPEPDGEWGGSGRGGTDGSENGSEGGGW